MAPRFLRSVIHELVYRLTGEYPPQFLDLADLRRVNKLLAPAGTPPLAVPPTPDPIRGERAMRVYELSLELREALPLAFTPAQREAFLAWVVHHSTGEHAVSADEALAALAHFDRLPDRGLEFAYRLQPAWQEAVPDALTPRGFETLKRFVTERYGLRGKWIRGATLGTPAILPPPLSKGGRKKKCPPWKGVGVYRVSTSWRTSSTPAGCGRRRSGWWRHCTAGASVPRSATCR